jgi:drug/metabolite transporter (DMT)-like permease
VTTAVAPVAGARTDAGNRFGVLAVLAATTCWGLGGVLGKSVGASGLVVSFYRLWMGAVVLNLVLLVMRRRLTWDVLKWSWLGGVCFGLNVALYFTSVRMTSIANVAIIGSLTPVIVFPIAVKWMGERVTRKAIVCSALAIAGVVVVVLAGGSSGQRALSGDLLAVVNLVSWAAFFLVTKHARKGVGTLEYLAAMTLVAAITVTPIAFLTGQDFGSVEGVGWLWLVLLVLIPGAAGHGLMTWAHAHVDVSTSSVLVLGEPVLATIAAAVFLSESVNAVQMLGMAGVVAALAVLAVAESDTVEPEPVAAAT